MIKSIVPSHPEDLQPIVDLVTNSVTSSHSQRAYAQALTAFLNWYDAQGRPGMNKATVNAYRAELVDRGKSPSSVNLAMSGIRKLATEAADNGLLDPVVADGIRRVKGVKRAGVRTGNWLTLDQAQKLIRTPDITTPRGLRDRAILAVMIGGGLRRSEVANLDIDDVQQRDARWVIVDLVGKGNRVRTVPIPAWTKTAVDEWATAGGIRTGKLFRPINKGGNVAGDGMTPQAIYNTVDKYSAAAGFDVAAHDLRRTFAKLAHGGGAALDQIQLTLGHASIQTTERYLGVEQNLHQAPCDVLGLHLR
jgi:site-specific recombinase XerD